MTMTPQTQLAVSTLIQELIERLHTARQSVFALEVTVPAASALLPTLRIIENAGLLAELAAGLVDETPCAVSARLLDWLVGDKLADDITAASAALIAANTAPTTQTGA